MPRKINWKNPQALIYEDNYGYGMNYYQPMIDYIETKERTGRAKYPHLPWTNERGLDAYSPRKIVRCYSADDLTRISRQTEARIKTKLKDFKSTTKSKFQLESSVAAASITRKVRTEEKKSKKIIKEIDKIKHKMAAEDIVYQPDMERLVEEGLKSAQKYLQGKSAKAIEGQLLHEARKHITEGIIGEIDIKKYQRNAFINTYDTKIHSRMMCERMQKEIDESFMRPLDDLSMELKGFDKKTTQYFFNKR